MLKERIIEIVKNRDAEKAGKICDFLRFSKGMNYNQVSNFVQHYTGCTSALWEQLMQEADYLESGG